MESIIKSKKFKLIAALICSLQSLAGSAQGTMPLLQNIGTIPAQWVGQDAGHPNLKDVKQIIEKAYPAAVRNSGRFRVINENLVRTLWSKPEGRSQLASEYELHGYVSLAFDVRDETVGIQARILGPSLQNYILETSTVPTVKLISSGQDVMQAWMNDVIFRLFNRLPVDATVLGIQGDYVTLTGGKRQNLNVGDKLTIMRPYINSRHPANGTWMSFKHDVVGSVRVIDTKVLTSIAEITQQTDAGSIKIGDGVKIERLRSRQYFARLDERGGLPTIPRKPKSVFDTLASTTPTMPTAATAKAPAPAPAPAAVNEAAAGPVTPAAQIDGNPEVDEKADFDLILSEMFTGFADYGYGELGPRLWTFSGAADAKSSFPIFLFNYAAAGFGRYLAPGLLFEGQTEGHFGSTQLGGFFGFGAKAKFFYSLGGDFGFFRVGGAAGFNSIAISAESFGGGDYFASELIFGAGGNFNLAGLGINWFTDYSLHPVAVGQMGIRGTKRAINASSGGTLKVGGTFVSAPDGMNFGAYINSSEIDYGFDNGAKMKRREFSVIARANYNF